MLLSRGGFLAALLPSAGAVRYDTSVPVNAWPFIETHDAATGYLPDGGVVKSQLMRWTKTQTTGTSGQLECGARAFDWRPEVDKGGTVYMHHGGVEVKTPMKSAVAEIVRWADAHPADEDLVVLYGDTPRYHYPEALVI